VARSRSGTRSRIRKLHAGHRSNPSGGLTVRISRAAHATLRALAAEADEPMTDVLDKAVEAFRRQRFLENVNASFAALRQDPAAWKSLQQERDAWDVTLADGLESQ
jgi:hypothetical protein